MVVLVDDSNGDGDGDGKSVLSSLSCGKRASW